VNVKAADPQYGGRFVRSLRCSLVLNDLTNVTDLPEPIWPNLRIDNNRIAKFQRWQETWRSRWKTDGPPDRELTPEGNVNHAEWVARVPGGHTHARP
jgi:hypothetical protein